MPKHRKKRLSTLLWAKVSCQATHAIHMVTQNVLVGLGEFCRAMGTPPTVNEVILRLLLAFEARREGVNDPPDRYNDSPPPARNPRSRSSSTPAWPLP